MHARRVAWFAGWPRPPRSRRRPELVWLDLDVNSRLIFRDLGIYKFTGTICDNI